MYNADWEHRLLFLPVCCCGINPDLIEPALSKFIWGRVTREFEICKLSPKPYVYSCEGKVGYWGGD